MGCCISVLHEHPCIRMKGCMACKLQKWACILWYDTVCNVSYLYCYVVLMYCCVSAHCGMCVLHSHCRKLAVTVMVLLHVLGLQIEKIHKKTMSFRIFTCKLFHCVAMAKRTIVI